MHYSSFNRESTLCFGTGNRNSVHWIKFVPVTHVCQWAVCQFFNYIKFKLNPNNFSLWNALFWALCIGKLRHSNTENNTTLISISITDRKQHEKIHNSTYSGKRYSFLIAGKHQKISVSSITNVSKLTMSHGTQNNHNNTTLFLPSIFLSGWPTHNLDSLEHTCKNSWDLIFTSYHLYLIQHPPSSSSNSFNITAAILHWLAPRLIWESLCHFYLIDHRSMSGCFPYSLFCYSPTRCTDTILISCPACGILFCSILISAFQTMYCLDLQSAHSLRDSLEFRVFHWGEIQLSTWTALCSLT